jgi:hypothetical protein
LIPFLVTVPIAAVAVTAVIMMRTLKGVAVSLNVLLASVIAHTVEAHVKLVCLFLFFLPYFYTPW